MSDAFGLDPQRRRLGRGLTALLGGGAPAAQETPSGEPLELRYIAVDNLERNPFQPRKDFDPDLIGELADSIREHGLLQPVLVREAPPGFQIVAGERRWLAAKKAGLSTIACRVVDVIDKTACELALEENLKRKDLTDLEKAHAFQTYLELFQCSIEELGRQLSMSRSSVSNLLRLLELPEPVLIALQSGKITGGHARAMLPLQDVAAQIALTGRIQAEALSVRQTEALVRQMTRTAPAAPAIATATLPAAEQRDETVLTPDLPEPRATAAEIAAHGADDATVAADIAPLVDNELPAETLPLAAARPEAAEAKSNHVRQLEQQLGALIGGRVEIRLHARDAGEIVIPFQSNAEFEQLLGRLRRHAA